MFYIKSLVDKSTQQVCFNYDLNRIVIICILPITARFTINRLRIVGGQTCHKPNCQRLSSSILNELKTGANELQVIKIKNANGLKYRTNHCWAQCKLLSGPGGPGPHGSTLPVFHIYIFTFFPPSTTAIHQTGLSIACVSPIFLSFRSRYFSSH